MLRKMTWNPFFWNLLQKEKVRKYQFMKEKNREKIQVEVLGCTYYVTSQIPALVPVMMARAENADDQQLATKMVMRAADAMFGAEAVDEMCNNGIAASELAELVQQLFKMINGTEDDDDDSQELTDEDSRKTVDSGSNAKK